MGAINKVNSRWVGRILKTVKYYTVWSVLFDFLFFLYLFEFYFIWIDRLYRCWWLARWDGLGWNEMDWDGMRWDEMKWDASQRLSDTRYYKGDDDAYSSRVVSCRDVWNCVDCVVRDRVELGRVEDRPPSMPLHSRHFSSSEMWRDVAWCIFMFWSLWMRDPRYRPWTWSVSWFQLMKCRSANASAWRLANR